MHIRDTGSTLSDQTSQEIFHRLERGFDGQFVEVVLV